MPGVDAESAEAREDSQVQFLDRLLAGRTVLAVPVLTVLKTVEAPQLQFIAELVEMPHVLFSKVGHLPVNLHDKFQLSPGRWRLVGVRRCWWG